jgi:hypothetical protein
MTAMTQLWSAGCSLQKRWEIQQPVQYILPTDALQSENPVRGFMFIANRNPTSLLCFSAARRRHANRNAPKGMAAAPLKNKPDAVAINIAPLTGFVPVRSEVREDVGNDKILSLQERANRRRPAQVAQTFSLLYRRPLVCGARTTLRRPLFQRHADNSSAKQQTKNLRYSGSGLWKASRTPILLFCSSVRSRA